MELMVAAVQAGAAEQRVQQGAAVQAAQTEPAGFQESAAAKEQIVQLNKVLAKRHRHFGIIQETIS